MSNLTDFKLVTKAGAAAVFGICTKTIDNYIRDGLLPKPVQFASREYWHPAEFKAFLARTFRRDMEMVASPSGVTDTVAIQPICQR